jgi:DNA topoisomerase IA
MQILISCNSKISFLDSIFQKDADAVDARSEIDLRTGAAFTRFQTKLLQGKYHETQGVMLSYGPCQFPTLGFVVARDRRIEAFRPEDFWYLDLEVSEGHCTLLCEEERGRRI